MKNEFHCASGKCIPFERLCDGFADCHGNHDEKNCSLVKVDEEIYQKDAPPLGEDGEDTEITINIKILVLGSVDEIAETFQLRFFLQLQW